MFIHQIPSIVPALLPKLTWSRGDMDDSRKVYFTFDDGPTPEITKFVLDCLADYDAKGSFFCIGKNMLAHGDIVDSIVKAGHSMGNHTMNHANAWNYSLADFETDYLMCEEVFSSMHIQSIGFRPPYGRVNSFIYHEMSNTMEVFMWSILTGDYNKSMNPATIIDKCIKHIKPGSIIVFHDSLKAYPRLKLILPALLNHCQQNNLIPSAL